MKIAITIVLLLISSPASAKVWIMQWGPASYDVRETRGLWDYPIAVDTAPICGSRPRPWETRLRRINPRSRPDRRNRCSRSSHKPRRRTRRARSIVEADLK